MKKKENKICTNCHGILKDFICKYSVCMNCQQTMYKICHIIYISNS